MAGEIVAGYDGSAGSEQALSWAAREAQSRKVVLTICPAYASGETDGSDRALRGGERIIASGLRSAPGVMGSAEVHPLLVAGSAAEVLCERSRSAGMVVVGGRGLAGDFPSLLMGTVSLHVAAFARGPVVVVRGHWRPAAGYLPGPVVVGVDGSAASRSALAFGFEESALRGAPLLAAAQDAQMLVVGSRGRGGMADMVLGSVSQAVLYHAHCPVDVVHPR